MSIRVMLVDDHAVVRTGYRRLLELEGDLRQRLGVNTAVELLRYTQANDLFEPAPNGR